MTASRCAKRRSPAPSATLWVMCRWSAVRPAPVRLTNEPNMFLDDRVLTNAAILLLDFDRSRLPRVPDPAFRTAGAASWWSRRPIRASALVMQINAEPAAQNMRGCSGLKREELNSFSFRFLSARRQSGRAALCARAIQKVDEDDSLQFFCAIDEGIVLSIAQQRRSGRRSWRICLRRACTQTSAAVEAVLGFDCILRYVEMEAGPDFAPCVRACYPPTRSSASTPMASSSAPCI